jgi:hypothetical protein
MPWEPKELAELQDAKGIRYEKEFRRKQYRQIRSSQSCGLKSNK